MFWIVVAILTAAVAIVLMYPLMRKTEVAETRRDGEVAVYRDQLAELDRERAAGLIGEDGGRICPRRNRPPAACRCRCRTKC